MVPRLLVCAAVAFLPLFDLPCKNATPKRNRGNPEKDFRHLMVARDGEKKIRRRSGLTVGDPAVFALVTCPEVNLPGLETLARAVDQCAPDGLE